MVDYWHTTSTGGPGFNDTIVVDYWHTSRTGGPGFNDNIVVEHWHASSTGGPGFKLKDHHVIPKTFKMIPVVPLFSAQH